MVWICIYMEYICTKCKKSKPSTEYFFREKGYRRKQCKACLYEKNRRNYNHEKERFRKLKNNFGISQEEFMTLLAKQNGVCAICLNPQRATARNRGTLCVDHNHITGKIRGLLCDVCNRGLGMFNDDITRVSSAMTYLKESI